MRIYLPAAVLVMILSPFGVAAVSDTIDGFYGVLAKRQAEIVELKNGNFRYWSKSLVNGKDISKAPITGKIINENGTIRLMHPALKSRRWIYRKALNDKHQLIGALWPDDDEVVRHTGSVLFMFDPRDSKDVWANCHRPKVPVE